MNVTLLPGRFLFAAAMIALGIMGFVNGDFALVWQNVPFEHLPERTAIAYVCAIIELATGLGLLFARTVPATCRVLFPYMLIWLVLLEVPVVVQSPLDAGSWGSFGEIGAMTAGVWHLFASHVDTRRPHRFPFAVGSAGIRAARWLLIAVLPMLGADVIVGAVNAGMYVMQPWLQHLPWPACWAMLTGVCSIATCLAMLIGIWPRLAVTLEAAMVALIGLVYWAPDMYTGRTATTAFIITMLVSAGIWVVADSYRGCAWRSMGRDGSMIRRSSEPPSGMGIAG